METHIFRSFLNKILIYFSFFLPILFSFHCDNLNSNKNQEVLAVVGNEQILQSDFVKRYVHFKEKTGATDNGEARRKVLKSIIQEELLILEAKQRGLDSDGEGKYEHRRIEIQNLLNSYHKTKISSSIKILEDELQSLYIKLNTKIQARHLYAPTYEEADSLYHEVISGKSFEELAQNTFEDPVLRESGGNLGYFTVDEMDPAFEDAAFGLEIGQISKPIQTKDGYSIIRVDNRIVKPLLTEHEYSKHRHKLYGYSKKRKTKKTTQFYVDSLHNHLNIKFNQSVLDKIFPLLEHKNEVVPLQIKENSVTEFHNLRNEKIVYSDLGEWTVEEFQEFAQFTSNKQQRWIRTKKDLQDFIAGLVVRAYILSEANKLNLHRTEEFNDSVNDDFETYLLSRMERTIYNDFVIPEDSLLSYFNSAKEKFATPSNINLSEIVLNSRKDASKVEALLKSGSEFSDIARKYSVHKWSSEKGGELGYLTSRELGKWASKVFSIEEGKWIGPLEIDSSYIFLKCLDKIPAKPQTFEEAKSDVENAVRAMMWEKVRNQTIGDIGKNLHVQSFPEKLRTIKLN
jgi:parvulin-like peptidyl-prolyl isomerase